MNRLEVYTREGCHLCEEMLLVLGPWAAARGAPITLRDVDADAESTRRFGLRVPVLLVDGEVACEGRLDLAALEAAWRAGR